MVCQESCTSQSKTNRSRLPRWNHLTAQPIKLPCLAKVKLHRSWNSFAYKTLNSGPIFTQVTNKLGPPCDDIKGGINEHATPKKWETQVPAF